VTVASGQPLLPALEAHGLRVPHGCRMGVCNTCSCSKVGGTTQDLQSGESQAEPNSAVRLCISSASTDLTLDL
jgi:ferredoxin